MNSGFIPNGPWEGFYLDPGPEKHRMEMVMNFEEGHIFGTGTDNVGAFSWNGSYEDERGKCELIKSYSTHRVFYSGRLDENGIWGTWQLAGRGGGFHIWPVNSGMEKQEQVQAMKEMLKP